jgi:hypothetical protein
MSEPTTRRGWLGRVIAAAGIGPLVHTVGSAVGACAQPPVILIRSSWQTVNIGDIAHTPGLLRLLSDAMPEAELILWPSSVDRGVGAMLRRRFPKLRILKGSKGVEPREGDPDRAEAFRRADLMLHGSGPSLVGARDLAAWRKETGKPYGIVGVTIESLGDENPKEGANASRTLLEGAAFVFTRETRSLEFLRERGFSGARYGFTPDATLACDLRDEAAADALLVEMGLEPGRFLCVVPRLRYTPYWEMHPERAIDPAAVRVRTAVNEEHAGPDHAKLREAATAWARRTGGRIFAVPEMTYQVGLLRSLVIDPLPEDVRARAVALDRYWLTDEATSVYARAAAVLSCECHSPLLALSQGTPAVYARQPTDTWKGRMYPDLGFWSAEIDRVSGDELAAIVVGLADDPEGTRKRLDAGRDRVRDSHEKAMTAVRRALPQRGTRTISPEAKT